MKKEYRPKWNQRIPQHILDDPDYVFLYDDQWAEECEIAEFRYKLMQQEARRMEAEKRASDPWTVGVSDFYFDPAQLSA